MMCAAAVLDASLLVVRAVRAEIGRRRPHNLSVNQARALGFVQEHPEVSLGGVAEHLGLGAPTASKLMHALIARGLVRERVSSGDRRRRMYRLTAAGSTALKHAVELTRGHLAQMLAALSLPDREQLTLSMGRLREAIAASRRSTA